MKYTLNINQKAIIDNNLPLNLTQAAILDVMCQMVLDWDSMTKITSDNKTYFWFDYSKINKEAPILGLKDDSVYRQLKQMSENGFLEPHKDNKILGKPFYHLTSRCYLMYGKKSEQSEKNPNNRKKIHLGTEENPLLPTEIFPYNNNTNNNSTKDKEYSEVETSQEPTSFLKSENEQPLGNSEELPKVETVTEHNHLDSKISVNEIDRTPTPENCNAGNFLLLRQFAKLRAAKKGKRDVFTLRAWNMMCKAFAEYSKQYDARVLESHLNEALTKPNWTSPFGASWIGDALERLAKAMNLAKPTLANNAQVEQNKEPAFKNLAVEKHYQDSLVWIANQIPSLSNSNVITLNRKEYQNLMCRGKIDSHQTSKCENACFKFTESWYFGEFLPKVFKKLAGDTFALKNSNRLANIIEQSLTAHWDKWKKENDY